VAAPASARPGPGLALAALVAVAIWGGSPAATKLALETLPPVDVALLRTLLGCLLALPSALLLRLPLPRGGRQWRLLGLSAGCGFLLFPLLFSFGQIRTSATHATLILAFLPVLTALYALAWDRRPPSPRLVAGCLVALAGEAWLALSRDASAGLADATLGAISWSSPRVVPRPSAMSPARGSPARAIRARPSPSGESFSPARCCCRSCRTS